MASNVAFALRATLAKVSMSKTSKSKAPLSPANMFGVVNILSFGLLLPFALLFEARAIPRNWAKALEAGAEQRQLVKLIIATGVSYYLYNELAFMCLGAVHPVTHAVGNTIKRVAVIAISIIYFKNPVTKEGLMGSAVAIIGVLMYSLALYREKAAGDARTLAKK